MNDEITSLDSILSQDQTTQPEPIEQPETPQTQEPQQPVEAPTANDQDTGESEPQPAPQDETPSSEDLPEQESQQFKTPQEQAAFQMAKTERTKRQELEQRLESLEHQLQQQQQPPEEVEQPDWDLDPEQAQVQVEQKVDNSLFQTRVDLSTDLMKSLKPDYDQVEEVFIEAAKKNPILQHQLRAHPNPAKFAYEQGKALQFQAQVGTDPDQYKANLREELKAEVLAEVKAEQAKLKQDVADAQTPNSLAGVPNSASREGPKWAGPTPLTDII